MQMQIELCEAGLQRALPFSLLQLWRAFCMQGCGFEISTSLFDSEQPCLRGVQEVKDTVFNFKGETMILC